MSFHNAYHLTCVSLTLDVGYLFTAAPAKCSCCSLPWTGYLLTAAPPDLECGVAVLGPIRRFLVIKGLRFSAPTPKAQCLLWHCIVSLSFISCLSETQHSMEFRITLPQSNSLLFKQNTLQFSGNNAIVSVPSTSPFLTPTVFGAVPFHEGAAVEWNACIRSEFSAYATRVCRVPQTYFLHP